MITRRTCLSLLAAAPLAHTQLPQVKSLRITVLTTMLADFRGIGEWGFAALVEADGRRILFDTGARPDTLRINAGELGVDLRDISAIVLSHNHGDHTTGLVSLPESLHKVPIHAGKGIFYSRMVEGRERNFVLANRGKLEGRSITEHDKPAQLAPGVWFTGPVPRKYPERNFGIGRAGRVTTPKGLAEDTIPEDSSLVFNTAKGLVVLSGCGHAGIANTLDYGRDVVRDAPIYAAIGGWHLFLLDSERLRWTAAKLREYGVTHFLGAHCTGVEAVYRIRELNRMARERCVVGAVGSSFDLDKGISAGMIAR